MKIFVISLKDSTQRRQHITKQMGALGLSFEFFDAVDGRKGLPAQYESMVDRNLAKRRLGKAMSDAEIACALSHALIYEKIANENITHSIILEDDAIIGNDFAEMIHKKICEKSGKDFIYLYHLYARAMLWTKRTFYNNYKITKLAKTPNCAVGYYVNLPTAKQIHKLCMPISWVSDWGVDIVNTFDTGAVVPRIVLQLGIEQSNLENVRTGKKSTFGQFGFMSWVRYKINKVFSYKISQRID